MTNFYLPALVGRAFCIETRGAHGGLQQKDEMCLEKASASA
jgi:hypothetical protein